MLTWVHYNNLFLKMFLVLVFSILTVSIIITYQVTSMSEKHFISTFSFTNEKVINQITTSFDTFSYNLATVFHNAQQSGVIKKVLTEKESSAKQLVTSHYEMMQQLNQMYSNIEAYRTSMIMLGKNDQLFTVNYTGDPIDVNKLWEHPITKNTMDRAGKLLFQPYASSGDHPEAIVASKTLIERSSGEIYGVLYIIIFESQFKQFYNNFTSEDNQIVLLNQSGHILSDSEDDLIGRQSITLLNDAKKIVEQNLEWKTDQILGKDYIILAKYLPIYEMYLVNLIDQKLLLNNISNQREIVTLSSIVVFITLGITFVISREMTNPMRKLVREISNMSKYHFSKPVEVEGGYETRQLANAFNQMLKELNVYVQELIQSEQKQRKLELESLQHQINPHFLYNTLTSVNFIVQQGEKEKAIDVIHALISLLQNTIGNISELNTVENEVINLKNYVRINQVRYGDRIKVQYFIANDVTQLLIPKLLLQPFVENAFFHAFNQQKEGIICILIAKKKGILTCEIKDNGDGMDLHGQHPIFSYKKKNAQLFKGIGIRNVNERIRLLYGKDYGVQMQSEIGKGTSVTIKLPIINGKQTLNENN
ncbi:sensor histidine kinase [Fervidibacillus albus]|uniref:Sensor histidine kinase n=1 Tax=Fervidibacillus albus TaxID=2980026 RepID=A0A9E8LXE6_9BACI|nr:sensor histidine kinase [Fervidibacillus albus]WAA11346.1 sensor histidine kinase [Fervidibacillus albus]